HTSPPHPHTLSLHDALPIFQPDEPDPPAAEQIKEMKAFVKELPDVKVSAIYMDGRRLRSNGPRPQFYNMMREIQDGKYDCVVIRSEEHTSELQSRFDLVCRL